MVACRSQLVAAGICLTLSLPISNAFSLHATRVRILPNPSLTTPSTVRSTHVVPRIKRVHSTSSTARCPNPPNGALFMSSVASSTPDKPTTLTALISTTTLIFMDLFFKKLFQRYSIAFPSSLGGCGILFTTLLGLNAIDADMGDGVYETFSPGADVLAKWLPVFFVPSLITLPLAQSMGSTVEFLKVAAVIVGGFFFTLFTTAWSVLGVRKLQGNTDSTADSASSAEAPATSTATPSKPFSDRTAFTLNALTLLSAIGAIITTKSGSALAGPMSSISMLSATLGTFVFGARLPASFKKVVHPLVTCTTLTWLYAKLFGSLLSKSFLDMLRSFKTGTLNPSTAGAGDVLLSLLGPAVVSLACQMYSRKRLMKENVAEVGSAVAVSSVGGLFGTAAMVRLMKIANPSIRLSLLSRNITSPLAMAIATILGADVSLAVSMVVVTGLIGANFGASILDAAGIKDAVARGLGIGAAAHGLGTAAFANEKDAFPFAAIAMALTASTCTVLVSVPKIRDVLMKIALG